jgi:hypothetical protein
MSNEGADNPQIKDTFAHFGLAMYWANVVELALVQTLLQIDFLKGVREDHVSGKKADRAQIDAEFGAFMQRQYNKMMGGANFRSSQTAKFPGTPLLARIRHAVYDRGRSHKNDRRTVERCEYI